MTEMFQQRRSFRREKDKGNVPLRKGVDSSKLASDSVSLSGYSKEEDSLPFELRQSNSTEASIKKLLAEEMSKEMESRRRPPSVIAKLMGLDALPTQSPLKKQQKKSSENYQQRTASIGSVEKSSAYEGRSSRMSSKEQQEFKDVFEVLEPSKVEKHSNFSSQKGMGNLKTSEAKMDLVRQKFLDVKRLSTDEKLQHSKEFHDALDVLDSNKDLLLKFLQEPDSLFTKHLHDLQGAPPPPSQPGHITVLKSSNANGIVRSKSDRKFVLDDVDVSVQKPEVGVVRAHNRHGIHSSGKVPNSQFGNKDEPSLVPTRIVVLKPNLRKAQNSTINSPGSLGGSHPGQRKHTLSRSCENLDLFSEVRDRRSSPIELEVLKNRNRGSREIAREITRQMRHSVNSRRLSSSILRGYAGDESSGSVSGNDSANESEVMTPASRHFYDWKNRYSPSSSHSNESSVSREAKKRLSERWKMTHRSQEMPRLGRGSTLGEMLAMPDRETRTTTLDSMGAKDGFTETVIRRNGAVTRWDTPLGISSRDGWKDECARSLPRSRSLPASSTAIASPKTSIRRRAHGSDRFSLPKELANWDPYKSKKVDPEQTEGFVSRSRSIRSRAKRSHPLPFVGKEKKHSTQEVHLKSDELSINLEEEHLPEDKAWNIELANDNVVETIHVTDEIAIAKPEDEMTSYESPQEQQSEETSCITFVDDRDTSSYNPDHSNQEMKSINPRKETSLLSHSNVTEVESPASCKEAGQPSPISVLEPPFLEETIAGSDSFEKVSADLHGLRMQLQLLKLESSDAHSDEFEMMVSSDEDFEERYSGHQKDNEEVNRDYSYVVDVLVDAGIHDEGMDALLKTCYASESLVHVDVFEKLEKKYTEQTAWTKSERRFLFDCINSGLLEILMPHMDLHPWVQPGGKIARKWTGPLTEELWKLLARREKEETVDPLDKVLGKDVKWMELGDDIDAVGREIERLLVEELVDEVVRML